MCVHLYTYMHMHVCVCVCVYTWPYKIFFWPGAKPRKAWSAAVNGMSMHVNTEDI